MLLLPFADESADDAFDPAADAAADVDDTAAVAAANANDSADLPSIEYSLDAADPADLARATQASTSQSCSGPFPEGFGTASPLHSPTQGLSIDFCLA